jgi:hypothetical protein
LRAQVSHHITFYYAAMWLLVALASGATIVTLMFYPDVTVAVTRITMIRRMYVTLLTLPRPPVPTVVCARSVPRYTRCSSQQRQVQQQLQQDQPRCQLQGVLRCRLHGDPLCGMCG